MNRNLLHFLIDIPLFLAVLGLAMTGLLMAFVLPPGQGGAQVWGISRHEWGDIHYWTALSMLTLALVHVTLNWTWICCVVARLVRPQAPSPQGWRQYMAGIVLVAVLVLVVGGFLWTAASSKVARDGGGGRGEGSGHQGYHGGR